MPGCPADANVADHVNPVDAFTTDAEFEDDGHPSTLGRLPKLWRPTSGLRPSGASALPRSRSSAATNPRAMFCPACERPMGGASCDGDERAYRWGEDPVGPDVFPGVACRDCGVLAGGYHHDGCAVARCRVCDGQCLACVGEDHPTS